MALKENLRIAGAFLALGLMAGGGAKAVQEAGVVHDTASNITLTQQKLSDQGAIPEVTVLLSDLNRQKTQGEIIFNAALFASAAGGAMGGALYGSRRKREGKPSIALQIAAGAASLGAVFGPAYANAVLGNMQATASAEASVAHYSVQNTSEAYKPLLTVYESQYSQERVYLIGAVAATDTGAASLGYLNAVRRRREKPPKQAKKPKRRW
jgi:hypothetical protein